MYDQVGFYSRQLQAIDGFLINALLIVSVINLLVYLLVTLKTTTFRQQAPILLTLTVVLVYILLVESYQFYYLTNYYDESF